MLDAQVETQVVKNELRVKFSDRSKGERVCWLIFGTKQESVSLERVSSLPTPVDPIQSLGELVGRVQNTNQVHLDDLKERLRKSEGFEFNSAAEFVEFKNVFKEVTEAIGVRPLLPNGRRGSLQIRMRKNTSTAWASVCAHRKEVSCGSQANTIPAFTLG